MSEPILVVALFDQPDDARAAMITLEAHGFDADEVHLAEQAGTAVATAETDRESDAAVFKSVGRRALTWGAIGAVAGAALGFGVAAIVSDLNQTSLLIALLGGGIFGFLLAALWGGAYRLPVNEEAFDTLAIDPQDSAPVRLEVRASGVERAEEASRVLRSKRAKNIELVERAG